MRPVFSSINLLILATLLSVVLTGCFSTGPTEKARLASPEEACKSASASWQGIIPGQTTQSEVIKLLGQPHEKGRSKWNKAFFLYPPITTAFGDSYGNSVIFRDDSIVEWIDVWVSNLDSKFHTVAEFAQQYGTTLDQVYVRGMGDQFGPEQVYVWANCGIAVTAVPESEVKRSVDEVLPLAEPVEISNEQLVFRHPVYPEGSVQPRPDIRQIIVRQFIFQPTALASFDKNYYDWIPYLSDKRFYRLVP